MPRFVILKHELPAEHSLGTDRGTHWDFMLESGSTLRTWALAQEPTLDIAIRAEQLADHRPAYLDYEGPVSGNRGQVARWDAGDYEVLSEREGQLLVRLRGQRLACLAKLSHEPAESHFWSVSFFVEPIRG